MSANMLLKNRQLRGEIVKKINKMVDLPWIGEKVEGQLIAVAVNACFDALTGKVGGGGKRSVADRAIGDNDDDDDEVELELPPVGDAEADEKAKQDMVDKINKQFDIPLINEDQEAEIIRSFVDALFSFRDNGDAP